MQFRNLSAKLGGFRSHLPVIFAWMYCCLCVRRLVQSYWGVLNPLTPQVSAKCGPTTHYRKNDLWGTPRWDSLRSPRVT